MKYTVANKFRVLSFYATKPDGYAEITVNSENRPGTVAFAKDVHTAEIAAGFKSRTFRYYFDNRLCAFKPLKRDFAKNSF